jgi:putative hemolysin
VIEGDEREMIHGIIEIGDKAVREVMVPRTDINAIDRESSLDQIVEIVRNSPHTRLPVFEHDLDRIVGVIHAKDLLRFLAQEPQPEFRLEQLMRPITYTPESKKVDELLHEMQAQRVHMVIVLDEYGGTAGLVTLEDLLEEIVGEIRDEYDVAEEEQLHIVSETEALVDARFSIAELNDVLDLGIEESDDYDSVGGYVLATLGRFPAAGTTFQSGPVRWTVEAVTGYRILRVRLVSSRPWPEEALIDAGLRPPEPKGARSQEGGES